MSLPRARRAAAPAAAATLATLPAVPTPATLAVSALVGRPLLALDGTALARVVDVVVPWGTDAYPVAASLLVRAGRHAHALVPCADLVAVGPAGATLAVPHVALEPADLDGVEGGLLARDVLDRQVVDRRGANLVRANDLVLVAADDGLRLVGVDVGAVALVRRLGPRRWRARPPRGPVIDWADVQPLGPGAGLRTGAAGADVARLRREGVVDLLAGLTGEPAS
jgi:hypothetical protein